MNTSGNPLMQNHDGVRAVVSFVVHSGDFQWLWQTLILCSTAYCLAG